jgi:hypothetical protein
MPAFGMLPTNVHLSELCLVILIHCDVVMYTSMLCYNYVMMCVYILQEQSYFSARIAA